MKSFVVSSLVAFAGMAVAIPQGVTNKITPAGSAPAGCQGSMGGNFEITIVEQLGKRDLTPAPVQKRDTCGGKDILVLSLADGVLKDAVGRTGYIANNFQFQFDAPPQSGALYTAGFSVCGNGSLALGASTTFYACLSGTFYNLYDRHWAAQCSPVHVTAMPCSTGAGAVSQIPDGQIVGTSLVATTIVTVLPDGQPQAIPTKVPVPICQINDGQVQGHTTPCASLPPKITPAPPASGPKPTAPAVPAGPKPGIPVSQIPDGQIQVPRPSAPAAPGSPAPPKGTVAPPAATVPASSVVPKPSAPTGGASVTPRPAAPPAATSAPPAVAGAARFGSSSLIALVIGVFGAVLAL